jgi:hypothetical protein
MYVPALLSLRGRALAGERGICYALQTRGPRQIGHRAAMLICVGIFGGQELLRTFSTVSRARSARRAAADS